MNRKMKKILFLALVAMLGMQSADAQQKVVTTVNVPLNRL